MKILLGLCALSGTEGLRKRMPLERKFVGFQQCQDTNPLGWFSQLYIKIDIGSYINLSNLKYRQYLNFITNIFKIPAFTV